MDQQHSEDGSIGKDGGKDRSANKQRSSKTRQAKESDHTNRPEAMLAVAMDTNDPLRINREEIIPDPYVQFRHAQTPSSVPIDDKISMYDSSQYLASGDHQYSDVLRKPSHDILEPTPIREGKINVIKKTETAVNDNNNDYRSHDDRPTKRLKYKSLSMPSFPGEPHHHLLKLPDKARSLASSPMDSSIATTNPNIDNTSSNPFSMASQMTRIEPCPLPQDYKPGPYDVICGRGKAIKESPGNLAFRSSVQQALSEYSQATTKIAKTIIVTRIIYGVRSKGGSFIRPSSALKSKSKARSSKTATSGRLPADVAAKVDESTWYEVGDTLAREKTGQAFRDCLDELYRSSTKAKRRRKREEKEFTESASTNSEETKKPRTKKKSTAKLRIKTSAEVNRDGSILTQVVSSGTFLSERPGTDKASPGPDPYTLQLTHEMERLVLNNEAINMILDGVDAELERLSSSGEIDGGRKEMIPPQDSVVEDEEDGVDDDDSNVMDLFMDSSRMILTEIKSDPAIQERVHQIAAFNESSPHPLPRINPTTSHSWRTGGDQMLKRGSIE